MVQKSGAAAAVRAAAALAQEAQHLPVEVGGLVHAGDGPGVLDHHEARRKAEVTDDSSSVGASRLRGQEVWCGASLRHRTSSLDETDTAARSARGEWVIIPDFGPAKDDGRRLLLNRVHARLARGAKGV